MKSKIFKILIPILVLALLFQVPLMISASATDVATDTHFAFEVSKAPAGKAGDIQVKLTVTGTADAGELSAIGATLVVKTKNTDGGTAVFDMVDKSGNVVTSTYETDSKAVPNSVAIEYADFVGTKQASLASFNAANGEMYIFISAMLIDEDDEEHGLVIADDTLLATLYLKSNGFTPSDENMRIMNSEEFRNTCPGKALYPAAVSLKSSTLVKAETEGVTNAQITFVLNGSIQGTGGVVMNNADREATVVLKQGDTVIATTTTVAGAYEFSDVEAGTYYAEISAPGALTFTVNNIQVQAGTPKTIEDTITLLFGDADMDGAIGAADISEIITHIGDDTVIASDADGDGFVTSGDLSVVLLADHVGVEATNQVLNLA